MADIAVVTTRASFEAAILGRISDIRKKKLVDRAISACNHFFKGRGHHRDVPGVKFLRDKWEQGSDYTTLDFEIEVPLDMNGSRWISIRHQCQHWQPDQVEVRILSNPTVTIISPAIVFRVVPDRGASGNCDSKIKSLLQIEDDLICEAYIPGDWENFLNGEKLEAFASAYDGQQKVLEQKKTEQHEKEKREQELARPLSDSERRLAERLGILVK
ncbi:MAG: hypothetical protein HYS44_01700 [Candidatus Niyogibacteria bacterium]|nr:hypothetical protein [Candidatus Niyogibacteria bacterium]